jgi:hypothetical protein
MLKKDISYAPVSLLLQSITLHHIPKFSKDSSAGGSYLQGYILMKNCILYSSKPDQFTREQDSMKLTLSPYQIISGDIKIEFYHKNPLLKKEKLFHFWFNTAFVENMNLKLEKAEIDKAHKDKSHKLFDKDFYIELQFVDPATYVPPVTTPDSTMRAGSSTSVSKAPPPHRKSSMSHKNVADFTSALSHLHVNFANMYRSSSNASSSSAAANAAAHGSSSSGSQEKTSPQPGQRMSSVMFYNDRMYSRHDSQQSLTTELDDDEDDAFEYDVGEEEELESSKPHRSSSPVSPHGDI